MENKKISNIFRWKNGKGMNRLLNTAMLSAAVFLSSTASAAIVYEDMGFIKGSGGVVNKFQINEAGAYQVSLIDFKYPTSFDTLSVQITQGSQNPLAEVGRWDEGMNIFNASAPGVYYANVSGNMGDKAWELGLYGLQVTTVPIPPSFIMLISGIVALAAFGKGGRKLSSQCESKTADKMVLAPT
jgi:hypothetical protein